MKGKELRKKVKEFSHKTNFYKLGLVKRYLKKQYKEKQELVNAIPKVTCPVCGSHRISIGSDESEYSSEQWLYCEDCDEDFEDAFDYIHAVEELSYSPWSDRISIELYFEEPNVKTFKWQEFCEKEIKEYLGLIKEEPRLEVF